MLLLVMEAELDEVGAASVDTVVEEPAHRLVDVAPVLGDLGHARSRHSAASRPRIAGTDALVVRVEEVPVGRVEGAVAGECRLEQERLEEPRRVGPVPLGRAHVGHGLDGLVLGRQGSGQRLGQVADLAVARASSVDCSLAVITSPMGLSVSSAPA